MHYVLRYFTSLQPRPPVGAPFTVAEEWWANYSNLMESYRDYLQARQALGDPPTFGDSLDRTISWQGKTDTSSLAGKPVRLRFQLNDADVYAFQFTDE